MTEVLAIVGPTASGKTALALALGAEYSAEIVNLDAFLIYRGMDIGTAKPTLEERNGIPHHLVDVVEIDHQGSVVGFQDWTEQAISEIQSKGRLAIAVGGSGMYVRAVLDELEVPVTDPEVRARLNGRLEKEGAQVLHQELTKLDPTAASLIAPGNSRRLVRALEVIELTGEPYAAALPDPVARYSELRIGLDLPRPDLEIRVEQRIREMLASGWVEEVEQLAARGLFETPTAHKAIGYAEIWQLIQGQLSFEETVAQITINTMRFSKRQMQWFRRDGRVKWFEALSPSLISEVKTWVDQNRLA